MAGKTLVTVEEYLHSSFDGPEPDFVDGEIVERHLGSFPHFKAQERVLEFFRSLRASHSLFGYPEVTLKISPKRYRVADVAVFGSYPMGDTYPTDPPLFAIEIVSNDDRHRDIIAKLADYHAWGVKHIWSVDPWTRKLFIYDDGGYHEVRAYELPEFSATLSPAEIFEDQTPQL